MNTLHRKSPKLSSALIVKESKLGRELDKNSFGVLTIKTNGLYGNANHVIIFTSGICFQCRCFYFNADNFLDFCALFTARKSIKSNWTNDKDEYSAPNTSK